METYTYTDPLTRESTTMPNFLASLTSTRLLDAFPDQPPFTIQRLAELVAYPTKHYQPDQPYKFLAAIERVLSVSSATTAFEKLDTEKLIRESQSSMAANQDHGGQGQGMDPFEMDTYMEDSDDLEDAFETGNGHTADAATVAAAAATTKPRSNSILSQVSSVVVMSPIPWASAADIEQARLDEGPLEDAGELGEPEPEPEHEPEHEVEVEGEPEAEAEGGAEPDAPSEEEPKTAESEPEPEPEVQAEKPETAGAPSKSECDHVEDAGKADSDSDETKAGASTSKTAKDEEGLSKDKPEASESADTTSDATQPESDQRKEVIGAEGEKRRRLSVDPQGTSPPE